MMSLSWLGILTLSLFFIAFCFEAPVMLGVSVFFASMGVTFSYVWSRFTWFGIMVWLVYLSALLVMFLFFVSLAPNPKFSLGSGWEVSWASFSVVMVLTCFVSNSILSNTGFEWEGSCPLLVALWSDSSGVFMSALVAYLFFVVVVVSKLGSRGGGALRSV